MANFWTVYYTKTTHGEIVVKAPSPDAAEKRVEDGDVDFGGAKEYEDSISVYEVQPK